MFVPENFMIFRGTKEIFHQNKTTLASKDTPVQRGCLYILYSINKLEGQTKTIRFIIVYT